MIFSYLACQLVLVYVILPCLGSVYLSNRRQSVNVSSSVSAPLSLQCSVPQPTGYHKSPLHDTDILHAGPLLGRRLQEVPVLRDC